jgi:hypothetical protein
MGEKVTSNTKAFGTRLSPFKEKVCGLKTPASDTD